MTTFRRIMTSFQMSLQKGDTADYKTYFQKIDPKKADELYEEIMKEEKPAMT